MSDGVATGNDDRSAGFAALTRGRVAAAAAAFGHHLAAAPADHEAWIAYGYACQALDRSADADAAWRLAVALHPGADLAYQNLATAADRRGARGAAAAHLRRRAALRPRDPAAIVAFGESLRALGHCAAAEACYGAALARQPDNAFWQRSRRVLAAERRCQDTVARLTRPSDLALAEMIWRRRAEHAPDDPQARHWLAVLAARAGVPQPLPRPAPDGPPRWLVIKAWGHGFWSDASHLLGGALLAELTGRIPVTAWGANSRYHGGRDADCFRDFFEPVSAVTLADIPIAGPIFPPKWTLATLDQPQRHQSSGPDSRLGGLHFLARREAVCVLDYFVAVRNLLPWIPAWHRHHGQPLDVVLRDLAARYLRPRAELRAAATTFRDRWLGPRYLALHVRGGEKGAEYEGQNGSLAQCLAALERLDDGDLPLFALTDGVDELAQLRRRFGRRVICTDAERAASGRGVHIGAGADRHQLGVDVLTDVLIATAADGFVGDGASNVAAFVSVLKPWPPGRCRLLGRSILDQDPTVLFA
jgi:hypothetical protein